MRQGAMLHTHPLVEPPRLVDGDRDGVELRQHQPGCLNGARQPRGVDHVDCHAVSGQHPAGGDGLGPPLRRQLGVLPAGEKAQLVVVRLAVPDDDHPLPALPVGRARSRRRSSYRVTPSRLVARRSRGALTSRGVRPRLGPGAASAGAASPGSSHPHEMELKYKSAPAAQQAPASSSNAAIRRARTAPSRSATSAPTLHSRPGSAAPAHSTASSSWLSSPPANPYRASDASRTRSCAWASSASSARNSALIMASASALSNTPPPSAMAAQSTADLRPSHGSGISLP
eukprot:scaffold12924_cov125-Isochrysis_galbana.AAC.7